MPHDEFNIEIGLHPEDGLVITAFRDGDRVRVVEADAIEPTPAPYTGAVSIVVHDETTGEDRPFDMSGMVDLMIADEIGELDHAAAVHFAAERAAERAVERERSFHIELAQRLGRCLYALDRAGSDAEPPALTLLTRIDSLDKDEALDLADGTDDPLTLSYLAVLPGSDFGYVHSAVAGNRSKPRVRPQPSTQSTR